MKTIIIGAGFTGLSAAIKTGAVIYEMTDKSGGICRSYEKDGFQFSNGGPHWIFGQDEGLKYIKSLVEVREYTRKAGVYYNHTFPYPFQQTASRECELDDVLGRHTSTFRDDLIGRFGKEQFNLFFGPFNEKYTSGLMGEIIGQDEYKSPKTGTGWVSTFCDPVNGLSDLVDKMASKCDIRYGHRLIDVSATHKTVVFEKSSGGSESFHFDKLISTIPLDNLINMPYIKSEMGNPPKLPYTSVLVINIGAERGHSTPKEHWLYVPFCKSGFHRVAFYTNVDKTKAPEGKVGLSVEIAYLPGHEDRRYASKAQEVVKELQDWGWIGEEIITTFDYVPCAYTWQYNKQDVPNAIQWLKERDIISTGRYGKWHFQGLTQSIEDGFNV